MYTAVGLVLFVVFIAAVIALAAGITWLVVKLSPPPKQSSEQSQSTS